MRSTATRELLAPLEDVWGFVAEPYHLTDWWPELSGVQPDRRGLSPGARWEVLASPRPGLFTRPQRPGLLLVREVEAPHRAAWHLTAQRLDVEVVLAAVGSDRTRATVAVSAPLLAGRTRTLARRAVGRLYDLCQTAATLD